MRAALLGAGLLLCAGAAALAQEGRNPPLFPDIELAQAEGSAVRLSQLKGNVIFLNFWATWCGPCRLELPIVQKLYDRYSDRNFVVLTVNLDADRRKIEPFLREYNISLPVYFAAPEDAGQMTQWGIPSTFIVGSDRTLIDQFVGYSKAAEERWKQVLEKHLNARKPAR